MSKPLDRDMAGIDRDIPGNDRDIPGIDRDIPAIDRNMVSTSENLSLARLRSHNVHISVQKWQAAMLTLMLRQVLSKNVLQHILIEFSLLNGINQRSKWHFAHAFGCEACMPVCWQVYIGDQTGWNASAVPMHSLQE